MKGKLVVLFLALTAVLLPDCRDIIYAQDYSAAGTVTPEKFVVSVSDIWERTIILQTFELHKNKIILKQSNSIPVNNYWEPLDSAITFRNENGAVNFDVYYTSCVGFWWCQKTKLSMIRVDSNLDSIFSKNLRNLNPGGAIYELGMQRVQEQSGLSLRLLTGNGASIVKQNLQSDGRLSLPSDVGIGEYSTFSSAEDGGMIATTSKGQGGRVIHIQYLEPKGLKNTLQTQDRIRDLALTGPIATASPSLATGSIAESNRYLFFVVERRIGTQYNNRVMYLKINNLTGKFIGPPKALTEFKNAHGYPQAVAVSPNGKVVLYSELDTSCDSEILKAQVFNLQNGTKIGSPQTILGCNDTGFYGISVTQFQ